MSTIEHKPTAQQQAFIDFCLSSTGHGALIARAGCGKTSTIMLAVAAIAKRFPNAEVTVCAYNKAIAEEISGKLKKAGYSDWKKYQASTIHSMGYGLIKFLFKPEIDDKKVRKLIRAYADRTEIELNKAYAGSPDRPVNYAAEYESQVERMVAVAKQAAVGFFDDLPIGDTKVWTTLADHFDINGFEKTTDLEACIKVAQTIYRQSLELTSVIDFDDMVLFPLVKNIRVRFGRDFIFLDEAQDLSRARQALAKKFLKPTGRMFIIGDDRQAIYGFSGADADALNNLTKSLNATVLPLTVTWRCPKAVVEVAKTIVPDIEAAPEAPEGEVVYTDALPGELTVGDAILCRKTAPLITLAYQLIRQGKAAKVEGRDIGNNLLALVNRWKVTTIDAFIKRLEAYRDREVQKAQAKDQDSKVEQINDRCDTLREICSVCISRQQTSLQSVRDFIEGLFADNNRDCVVLATYHRSKGREWGRVYLWDHKNCCPSKYAKQEWQKHQEENLAYVAFTRSQRVLTFIDPPAEEKKEKAA